MPANVVDRLLMATDEEKRKQINQLLQYPEDSAGSIMNVDYIALSHGYDGRRRNFKDSSGGTEP